MKIKCKSGVDAELCTEAAVAKVEVEEVVVFPSSPNSGPVMAVVLGPAVTFDNDAISRHLHRRCV